MACIDADGRLTRSGELILLAMMKPADVEAAAKESGLPLFKVRGAVRELSKAGLLTEMDGGFKVTEKGIEKLEDRKAAVA
jgi:predicted methyltransferase